MARFLDHTNSRPAAPFDTPGTAATNIAALLSGATIAVGEPIFCLPTHQDYSYTANTTFTAPASATFVQPQQLICVTSLSDPTTISSGATFGTTGNFSNTWSGPWEKVGITTKPGAAGTPGTSCTTTLTTTAVHSRMVLDNCSYDTGYTAGALSVLTAGNSNGTTAANICARNISVGIRHSGQRIGLGAGDLDIDGLTILSGSVTSVAALFYPSSATITANICNADLSPISTITGLLTGANPRGGYLNIINSKMPATFAALSSAIAYPGFQFRLINCDSANTNKRTEVHDYGGSIITDTGITATTSPGTALDGTAISHKMVTLAAKASLTTPLATEWFVKKATATETIIGVECLVEGSGATAMTNAELWLEVQACTATGSPLGVTYSTRARALATPTTVSAGTTAFSGDGYATERTHRLTQSVTPTRTQFIRWRVCLARPSAGIYLSVA